VREERTKKLIIPSIDIMDGKAVQLRQGKEVVLERDNVLELGEYFGRFGEISVIDIDAAMGKGSNTELVKQLCKIADCRVGGGIRTIEKAKEILSFGAKKIIIGTAASELFLSQLPRDKVLLAIDTNKGKIVTQGWQTVTSNTAEELVRRFNNLCSGYLYTIVEKEGMMEGTDIEAVKHIRSITDKELIAAGGISSIEEIIELDKIGASCQLGMSIYTGKIDLEEAFIALLDMEKGKGLIPTIVQDRLSKEVLMMAYSDNNSIKKSLKTGKATYYSRSRKSQWTKGETSGNTQKLKRVKYDCDKDALLYVVDQTGVACHEGSYSCFGERDFDFGALYEVIQSRLKELPDDSFTTKLFQDELFLKRKINEEAFEVIHTQNKEELIWEVSDLTYFIMTLMVKHGVTIEDIKDHLSSRRK